MTVLAEHFAPTLSRNQAFPAAQLLDVTLRDGSFAVGFRWDESSVHRIVGALARAHIPFVELGYLGGVPDLHNVQDAGITADFPLALAGELAARFPETNFALMVHPGALARELDYREIRQAGISLLRYVFHPSWGEKLKQGIASARQAGLSTTVNIALATRYDPASLLALCRELGAALSATIYLADTCSAFYPHQVQELMRTLATALPVPLGFHSHDFMSLAFANSLAAASAGATYIDVSLSGIGRGAGNLAAELWCIAAVAQGSERYNVEALLDGLEVVRAYTTARQSDVVSLVCGACNLTPPEEDLLRHTASLAGVEGAVLACRYALQRANVPHLSRETLLALVTEE
jgi:4-hydroxy 2-oxovalerate aldolase